MIQWAGCQLHRTWLTGYLFRCTLLIRFRPWIWDSYIVCCNSCKAPLSKCDVCVEVGMWASPLAAFYLLPDYPGSIYWICWRCYG
jgi:hypothetical protein